MTKVKKTEKVTVSARIDLETKRLLDLSPYNVREHLEMNLGVYNCSSVDSQRKRYENELEVCVEDIRSKRREKKKIQRKIKELDKEEKESKHKQEQQQGEFNMKQAKVFKEVATHLDNRAKGVMSRKAFLKLCDKYEVDARTVYNNLSPELKDMVDWYNEVY